MKIKSNLTGIQYEPSSVVYILNQLQVRKYLESGALLLDVLPGRDGKLVFVFSREDTKELYNKWCNYEL